MIVRDYANPIGIGYSNEKPSDETIAAMKEAERIIARGGTGRSFTSAEEMMAFIASEADE